MKTSIFLLAFAVSGCAQSYHIIRVIPASTTPGSVLLCGDSSHATTCVTDQANAAGTVISTTASRIVGSSDDAYLAVDAGGSARLGFTKKSGVIPRLTYGSGQNFELAQSSGADIGASNTFTVHFVLDQTSGAPTFTFNSAAAGITVVQSGAGAVLTSNVNNSSTSVSIINSGSGTAGAFQSVSGIGVSGVSTSSDGVSGVTGSGIAVYGQATGGGGTGAKFESLGTLGVGLIASGTSLAAHFTTGDVTVDNTLTAGALAGPQPGGVNATGATVVGDAFQIATSGGGRVYSTGGSNTVTIGRSALSSDITLDTSGNVSLAHNLALSGTFSGTHAQNVGSGDAVSFSLVSSTLGLLVSSGGITVSGSSTPHLSVISNSGAGAALDVTTAGTISMDFTDSGGTCRMSFGSGGVTCPSDRRLKHNIKALGPEIASVMKLKPVSFQWRSNNDFADGLIAQDVQRIFPRAVHEGPNGYLNVSYQQLIPYLIRAIQDLQAEIDLIK